MHPRSGSAPTIEANGGPAGILKVVNSVIVNLPGVNVVFRQNGAATFAFNPPFIGPTPPYAYTLDPLAEVPSIVTNYAGVGKIDFELWAMERFNNPAVSARTADPDADGSNNYDEYRAGTEPLNSNSVLRITSIQRQNEDVQLQWMAGGNRTNVVQASFQLPQFEDISPPIATQGNGDIITNFVHLGGVSNSAARYYRVRIAP